MKVDLAEVQKAISGIPPQERKALILRDVLNLKYKEIAHILGVEINTVGVYIHRARSFLFTNDNSLDKCYQAKKIRLWRQLKTIWWVISSKSL